jgi:predicted molibdopterin-dependent oxidoreductase YjgC
MIDQIYHPSDRVTLTGRVGTAILKATRETRATGEACADRPTGGTMRKPKGRLTTPLVRDGGALRTATWDEALDRAAAGFARAREADTSTSFGIFSCSKASNEMNFLAGKLARQVMGTNNIDSCNRT